MEIFNEIINEVREENTFLKNYTINYNNKTDKNKNDILFFLNTSCNNTIKFKEYNIISKEIKICIFSTLDLNNIMKKSNVEYIKYVKHNEIEFKCINDSEILEGFISSQYICCKKYYNCI